MGSQREAAKKSGLVTSAGICDQQEEQTLAAFLSMPAYFLFWVCFELEAPFDHWQEKAGCQSSDRAALTWQCRLLPYQQLVL